MEHVTYTGMLNMDADIEDMGQENELPQATHSNRHGTVCLTIVILSIVASVVFLSPASNRNATKLKDPQRIVDLSTFQGNTNVCVDNAMLGDENVQSVYMNSGFGNYQAVGCGLCLDAANLQPAAYWAPHSSLQSCQTACSQQATCTACLFRLGGDGACVLYMSGPSPGPLWSFSPNQNGGVIAKTSGGNIGTCFKKRTVPLAQSPQGALPQQVSNTVLGDRNVQYLEFGIPAQERDMWTACKSNAWFAPMTLLGEFAVASSLKSISFFPGSHPYLQSGLVGHAHKYLGMDGPAATSTWQLQYYKDAIVQSRAECVKMCHLDLQCHAFNYGSFRRQVGCNPAATPEQLQRIAQKRCYFLGAGHFGNRVSFNSTSFPQRPDTLYPGALSAAHGFDDLPPSFSLRSWMTWEFRDIVGWCGYSLDAGGESCIKILK